MLLKDGRRITLREEIDLLTLAVKESARESELLKRKTDCLQIYVNSVKRGCSNPANFARLEQSITCVNQKIHDLLDGEIISCDQLLDESEEPIQATMPAGIH